MSEALPLFPLKASRLHAHLQCLVGASSSGPRFAVAVLVAIMRRRIWRERGETGYCRSGSTNVGQEFATVRMGRISVYCCHRRLLYVDVGERKVA